MHSINVLCSGFFLISTAATLTIAPSQSLVNLVPGPSSIANRTADAQINGQANLTLDWPSKNGPKNQDIECSAQRYGSGLTYSSCTDAIASFKVSSVGWLTIGPRESRAPYNFYTPWRWISDDGKCIIDIISESGHHGMATATQLRNAATAVVEECVADGRGLGGMIYGVGWNKQFALAIRPYDPSQVICQEKPPAHPFEDYCDSLIQTMPASVEEEDTFGREGLPGVTAPVPFVHETESPHGCILAVVMDPSLPASTTDIDYWYSIWGKAVAIQGMCVRHGLEGSIGGAGDNGDLIIWMLEHRTGEPVALGNAALGTTIANNTKTPSANSGLPLPMQSVSSS